MGTHNSRLGGFYKLTPSIVAGASYAAKLTRGGGFQAETTEPIMIGQVQLVGIESRSCATRRPDAHA